MKMSVPIQRESLQLLGAVSPGFGGVFYLGHEVQEDFGSHGVTPGDVLRHPKVDVHVHLLYRCTMELWDDALLLRVLKHVFSQPDSPIIAVATITVLQALEPTRRSYLLDLKGNGTLLEQFETPSDYGRALEQLMRFIHVSYEQASRAVFA